MLFLSFIGFALRRTNVLETSLVFVYVVVSAAVTWCLYVWLTLASVLSLAFRSRGCDGVSSHENSLDSFTR